MLTVHPCSTKKCPPKRQALKVLVAQRAQLHSPELSVSPLWFCPIGTGHFITLGLSGERMHPFEVEWGHEWVENERLTLRDEMGTV